MNKSLIELLKEISTNPEHQKNLAKCKSKEEVFKYCSSICQGYTPEELNNFIESILIANKIQNKVKDEKGNLKDSELDKISGGAVETGTVDQIAKIIGTLDTVQRTAASSLKLFNALFEPIFYQTGDLDPVKISNMVQKVLRDSGMQ